MAAKDNLKDLLQERFAGHEAPVDPGLWQAISGQLAASAPAADGLADLLKDRFKDHELEPDAGVWDGISQQLGHGAAAGTAAGGGGIGGWLAAGIAATVVTGGLLFWALSPGTGAKNDVVNATTTAPRPSPAEQVEGAVTTPTPAGGQEVPMAGAVNAPPPVQPPVQRKGPDAAVHDEHAPADRTTTSAPANERADEHAPEHMDASKPGAHLAEVNRIIDQLIQQTINQPVVAQTESLPSAGLVEGRQPATVNTPETGDEVGNDPEHPVAAAPPVVWIPNAFSPGQRDGVNDELVVMAEGLSNIQVRIYSLDSRLMYRANDLKPWDGRDMGGQLCPQGYYFYAIEGLDGNEKTFSKGQTIYLFR